MGRQFAPGTAACPDVIRQGTALGTRVPRAVPRSTPRNPIPRSSYPTWL